VNKSLILSLTKDFDQLNLNEVLSKKLLEYEHNERKMFVVDELNKIIDSAVSPLLISDFEMLFNPEYQIDVLKLFIMLNRRKKLAIVWCGEFEEGKLRFSEIDYLDYSSYDVIDYDITCII
jgi:superoxide dismutase